MKELCFHCGRPTPYEINTPVEIDYSGAAERPLLNLLRTRCSTGADSPNVCTNTIAYSECCTIQSSKSQTVKAGEAFKFFLANEDGGFSYQQIPLSVEEVILSIDQMDKNILYSRCQRGNAEDQKDDKLFGMMLPMVIEKKKRLDWIEYG